MHEHLINRALTASLHISCTPRIGHVHAGARHRQPHFRPRHRAGALRRPLKVPKPHETLDLRLHLLLLAPDAALQGFALVPGASIAPRSSKMTQDMWTLRYQGL